MKYLNEIKRLNKEKDMLQEMLKRSEEDKLHLQELIGQNQLEICLLKAETEESRHIVNRSTNFFISPEILKYLGIDSALEIRAGVHVDREVTVWFSDIRSYSKMAESMGSKHLIELLNDYLHYASISIMKYEGFIYQLVGDGIMAIFPNSSDDSLMAVIDMFRGLKAYNEERAKIGKSAIKVGAGIHYGQVTLGAVGTEQRMDTAIIGDTVNLASRLENATKTYQIDVLISDSLYNNLKNPEKYHIREIDTVRVKGKQIPLSIFEVFDLDEEIIKKQKKESLPVFSEAFRLYKNGDFDKAFELFKQCADICPRDNLPPMYIKRCSTLIRIPPGPEWSGISGL